MSKKKAGKPKAGGKKSEAASDDWKKDAKVLAILRELEDAAYLGIAEVTGDTDPPTTFEEDATTALREAFGPGIHRRLHTGGGDWNREKGHAAKDGHGPLSAAFRLGQIAAILSTTDVISLDVAQVAAEAARKDKHCQRSGGAGDWC